MTYPDQTVRVPVTPTDAMIEAGNDAHAMGGWNDGSSPRATYLAMLAAAPSPEAEAWGAYARAICESEGRNWLALDNPRADCERWIKAGQACASLQRPQTTAPAVLNKREKRMLSALRRAHFCLFDRTREEVESILQEGIDAEHMTIAVSVEEDAIAKTMLRASEEAMQALSRSHPDWARHEKRAADCREILDQPQTTAPDSGLVEACCAALLDGVGCTPWSSPVWDNDGTDGAGRQGVRESVTRVIECLAKAQKRAS